MKDDWAIVVGISDYPDFGALVGPEADARDFHSWLTDQNGGDVPDEHVTLIVSSTFTGRPGLPTTQEIDDAFQRLVRHGRSNGGRIGRRLYLYFSGHGMSPGTDLDEAALLTARATPDMAGDHIPGRAYAAWLRAEALFDELVLVMDCCRDHAFEYALHMPPWAPTRSARAGGVKRFFALAASFGGKSYETVHRGELGARPPGAAARGVFTTALLEALRGGAADASGQITGVSVSRHAFERTRQLLTPRPTLGPTFELDPAHDIVFSHGVGRVPGTLVVTLKAGTATPLTLIGPGGMEVPLSGPPPIVTAVEPGFYVLRGAAGEEAAFAITGKAEVHVQL